MAAAMVGQVPRLGDARGRARAGKLELQWVSVTGRLMSKPRIAVLERSIRASTCAAVSHSRVSSDDSVIHRIVMLDNTNAANGYDQNGCCLPSSVRDELDGVDIVARVMGKRGWTWTWTWRRTAWKSDRRLLIASEAYVLIYLGHEVGYARSADVPI